MEGMYVVMPLVAVGLAAAFDFRRPLEIALVAPAVSPMPPLLLRKGVAAVILYLFVGLVESGIYLAWRRRRSAPLCIAV